MWDPLLPQWQCQNQQMTTLNHGRKLPPSNFASSFLSAKRDSGVRWLIFTARFLVDMDVWLMAANMSGTDQIFRNMAMFPGTRTQLQYTTAIQPRSGQLWCWFQEQFLSLFCFFLFFSFWCVISCGTSSWHKALMIISNFLPLGKMSFWKGSREVFQLSGVWPDG